MNHAVALDGWSEGRRRDELNAPIDGETAEMLLLPAVKEAVNDDASLFSINCGGGGDSATCAAPLETRSAEAQPPSQHERDNTSQNVSFVLMAEQEDVPPALLSTPPPSSDVLPPSAHVPIQQSLMMTKELLPPFAATATGSLSPPPTLSAAAAAHLASAGFWVLAIAAVVFLVAWLIRLLVVRSRRVVLTLDPTTAQAASAGGAATVFVGDCPRLFVAVGFVLAGESVIIQYRDKPQQTQQQAQLTQPIPQPRQTSSQQYSKQPSQSLRKPPFSAPKQQSVIVVSHFNVVLEECSFTLPELTPVGEYEALYVSADGSVLATLPFTVRPPTLSIMTPLRATTHDPIRVHFETSARHSSYDRLVLVRKDQELVDGKSRWVAKGMGKGEVLFDGVDAPSEGGEYEVLYLHPTPADTASSAATIGLFAPTAASSWWPAFSPLRLLSKADGGGSFVPHSTPSSSVLSAAPPSNKKRENALARSPVIVVHGPTVSPQLAWPEGHVAGMYREKLLAHFEAGVHHPPGDVVVLHLGVWSSSDKSASTMKRGEVSRVAVPAGIAEGVLTFAGEKSAPPVPGIYQLLYVTTSSSSSSVEPRVTAWSKPFFVAGPRVVSLGLSTAQYLQGSHAATMTTAARSGGDGPILLPAAPFRSPLLFAVHASRERGKLDALALARRDDAPGHGTTARCVRLLLSASTSNSSGSGGSSEHVRSLGVGDPSGANFNLSSGGAGGVHTTSFNLESDPNSALSFIPDSVILTQSAGVDARLLAVALSRLPRCARFCGEVLLVRFDAGSVPRLPGLYAPVYVCPRPQGLLTGMLLQLSATSTSASLMGDVAPLVVEIVALHAHSAGPTSATAAAAGSTGSAAASTSASGSAGSHTTHPSARPRSSMTLRASTGHLSTTATASSQGVVMASLASGSASFTAHWHAWGPVFGLFGPHIRSRDDLPSMSLPGVTPFYGESVAARVASMPLPPTAADEDVIALAPAGGLPLLSTKTVLPRSQLVHSSSASPSSSSASEVNVNLIHRLPVAVTHVTPPTPGLWQLVYMVPRDAADAAALFSGGGPSAGLILDSPYTSSTATRAGVDERRGTTGGAAAAAVVPLECSFNLVPPGPSGPSAAAGAAVASGGGGWLECITPYAEDESGTHSLISMSASSSSLILPLVPLSLTTIQFSNYVEVGRSPPFAVAAPRLTLDDGTPYPTPAAHLPTTSSPQSIVADSHHRGGAGGRGVAATATISSTSDKLLLDNDAQQQQQSSFFSSFSISSLIPRSIGGSNTGASSSTTPSSSNNALIPTTAAVAVVSGPWPQPRLTVHFSTSPARHAYDYIAVCRSGGSLDAAQDSALSSAYAYLPDKCTGGSVTIPCEGLPTGSYEAVYVKGHASLGARLLAGVSGGGTASSTSAASPLVLARSSLFFIDANAVGQKSLRMDSRGGGHVMDVLRAEEELLSTQVHSHGGVGGGNASSITFRTGTAIEEGGGGSFRHDHPGNGGRAVTSAAAAAAPAGVSPTSERQQRRRSSHELHLPHGGRTHTLLTPHSDTQLQLVPPAGTAVGGKGDLPDASDSRLRLLEDIVSRSGKKPSSSPSTAVNTTGAVQRSSRPVPAAAAVSAASVRGNTSDSTTSTQSKARGGQPQPIPAPSVAAQAAQRSLEMAHSRSVRAQAVFSTDTAAVTAPSSSTTSTSSAVRSSLVKPPSVHSQAAAPLPATSDESISDATDDALSRFVRMLRAGVPPPAVEHKMKMEGILPDQISAVMRGQTSTSASLSGRNGPTSTSITRVAQAGSASGSSGAAPAHTGSNLPAASTPGVTVYSSTPPYVILPAAVSSSHHGATGAPFSTSVSSSHETAASRVSLTATVVSAAGLSSAPSAAFGAAPASSGRAPMRASEVEVGCSGAYRSSTLLSPPSSPKRDMELAYVGNSSSSNSIPPSSGGITAAAARLLFRETIAPPSPILYSSSSGSSSLIARWGETSTSDDAPHARWGAAVESPFTPVVGGARPSSATAVAPAAAAAVPFDDATADMMSPPASWDDIEHADNNTDEEHEPLIYTVPTAAAAGISTSALLPPSPMTSSGSAVAVNSSSSTAPVPTQRASTTSGGDLHRSALLQALQGAAARGHLRSISSSSAPSVTRNNNSNGSGVAATAAHGATRSTGGQLQHAPGATIRHPPMSIAEQAAAAAMLSAARRAEKQQLQVGAGNSPAPPLINRSSNISGAGSSSSPGGSILDVLKNSLTGGRFASIRASGAAPRRSLPDPSATSGAAAAAAAGGAPASGSMPSVFPRRRRAARRFSVSGSDSDGSDGSA